MDWTRMFLFLFGTYLLFLQIANSHHLSGSTIRGVSRRISSRRSNGNRLLRVQTSSTTVNGHFSTRSSSSSRSNPRTVQSSSTSSLQQEVLALRRRLALAEEQRIREVSARQRLSQTRQSSARPISQSRSVRPTVHGASMNSRRVSGRMPTNSNRRTFQSNPSNFRRNSAPQIVIELERDNHHPMDNFQDMSSNFHQSSSNNFNSNNQNEEKQLLEMLSKLLATTPAPVQDHNNINDINALLHQLQKDPNAANQLQQVLNGVKQLPPEHKTQPSPPPQPPTPQTLWQQVQSLSDPRKARELRQKDPLHFAFLTSLLEGDIPDPPDIPDPIQPQPPQPPAHVKPVAVNVKSTTNVQKAETISVPVQKTPIVSASSPSSGSQSVQGSSKKVVNSKTNIKAETVVKQVDVKLGTPQKLSETPVFQPVNPQNNAHMQQPKIIVIRESAAGANPFVVQTDKFGQSSIVIDTGNPHLQKLIQAQQAPTIKPVVPAANNIANATSTSVQKQTVETKITAKDSGAVQVQKEINTKTVSQNGSKKTVVKTAVEVSTVLPVVTEPTTLPLETTEAP